MGGIRDFNISKVNRDENSFLLLFHFSPSLKKIPSPKMFIICPIDFYSFGYWFYLVTMNSLINLGSRSINMAWDLMLVTIALVDIG